MDTPDDVAHAIPSGGEQRWYQRDPVSLLLALRAAAFFGVCIYQNVQRGSNVSSCGRDGRSHGQVLISGGSS